MRRRHNNHIVMSSPIDTLSWALLLTVKAGCMMKGIAYLNMHKGGGNNTAITLIRHLRGANYAPILEEKCRAKFFNWRDPITMRNTVSVMTLVTQHCHKSFSKMWEKCVTNNKTKIWHVTDDISRQNFFSSCTINGM